MIVPRAPLQPGSRYAVSITANGNDLRMELQGRGVTRRPLPPIAHFPDTQRRSRSRRRAPSRQSRRRHRSRSPQSSPRVASARLRKSTPAPPRISPKSLGDSRDRRAAADLAAVSAPATLGSGTNWLATLNLYRTLLKLPPVEEDPALSHGCLDHAKYW